MGDFEHSADIDHLSLLADLQGEFHAHLVRVAPETPVPACGEWTVRDLAEHLSAVYLWAASLARGEDPPHQQDPSETGTQPLAERFQACAAHLHETLTAVPADASARVFGGEGPARFWHRRQLHETLIHLHDLAEAVDAPAPHATPEVWADGVDEVITVMHPRQVRLGRAEPPSSPVLLTAADTAESWTVPSVTTEVTAEVTADPAAELRGRAQDLALLLWGRRHLENSALQVHGDVAAVQELLRQPITP